MTIHVTPIPRLIDLATPAFTLGTSNAAGSAATAVSSNSTLLTFDATVPSTIAYSASAAAGSAVVAARRDHTHGMVAGPSGIYCRAYNDAVISCGNDTAVIVALNSERSDTDSMHDNTTDNSRITFKTAGWFEGGAAIFWESSTSGKREMWIRMNGSIMISGMEIPAPAAGAVNMSLPFGHLFSVDDYIELQVRQASGGALNLGSGAQDGPEVWATKTVG